MVKNLRKHPDLDRDILSPHEYSMYHRPPVLFNIDDWRWRKLSIWGRLNIWLAYIGVFLFWSGQKYDSPYCRISRLKACKLPCFAALIKGILML
jgi:hypothetical protein